MKFSSGSNFWLTPSWPNRYLSFAEKSLTRRLKINATFSRTQHIPAPPTFGGMKIIYFKNTAENTQK